MEENEVLEVDGTGECGRESQGIGFAGGGSRCDAADRDEVTGWGDSLRIANDEGVALFLPGLLLRCRA